MLGALRLFTLRRKLRTSLREDPLQDRAWISWLDNLASRDEILACPDPGWMVHVAYWWGVHHRVLMAAALRSLAFAAPLLAPTEWRRLDESTGQGNRFLDRSELTNLVARTFDTIVGVCGPVGPRLIRLPLTVSIRPTSASPLAGDRHLVAALGLLAVAAIQTEYGLRDEAAATISAAITLGARAEPERAPDMLEHLRQACASPRP